MDFDAYAHELRVERRQRIVAAVAGERSVPNVVAVAEIDSTNRLARSAIAGLAELETTFGPILLVAWSQTAGRGRLGRTWVSPAGLGIYATLAIEVPAELALETLPPLVGDALCRSLRELATPRVGLKWPNDLLIEGRKVGGILIETVALGDGRHGALIGFGINWLHRSDQLPVATATSLRIELAGEPPSMARGSLELATAVVRRIAERPAQRGVLERYRELLIHRDGDKLRYRVDDTEIVGTFRGFDETGRLLLEHGGRTVKISAGEIIAQAGARR